MSLARVHNFSVSVDGFGTGRHRGALRAPRGSNRQEHVADAQCRSLVMGGDNFDLPRRSSSSATAGIAVRIRMRLGC
jgi:hypothetical protein